jgi:hypothetical protein
LYTEQRVDLLWVSLPSSIRPPYQATIFSAGDVAIFGMQIDEFGFPLCIQRSGLPLEEQILQPKVWWIFPPLPFMPGTKR